MNEQEIESLLRKAPGVKTPAGLLERLRADVKVPRVERSGARRFERPSWSSRWVPALSFAAFFFACLVVIGMQTGVLSQLKQENDVLRGSVQNLAQLQAENQEYQRLLAQSQELESLRSDNADLQRLRAEVAQLQAQMGEVAKLRAENQRLATENANKPAGAENTDFFAEEKAKAERIACCNNLKQIGLAARIWEDDHKGIYPTNFICMTNELNAFRVLQCPSDKSRNVTNWAMVEAGNVSYEMLAPGASESEDPNTVFVMCPIHRNYCLIDGSVQQLSEKGVREFLKVINGRTVWTHP